MCPLVCPSARSLVLHQEKLEAQESELEQTPHDCNQTFDFESHQQELDSSSSSNISEPTGKLNDHKEDDDDDDNQLQIEKPLRLRSVSQQQQQQETVLCDTNSNKMSNTPLPASSAVTYGACELRDGSKCNNGDSACNKTNTRTKCIIVLDTSYLTNNNTRDSDNKEERKVATGGHRDSSGSEEGGELELDNNSDSDSVAEEKSFVQRMANVIPCLGIIFALGASIFLGSAGMLVKMTTSVHGIQVAVFRAMIQLVVYGFVISVRGLPFVPKRKEFKAVMGRATLGAISITFSYHALKLIPLGDATTIRFSLPIWTLIVSYLVLNESCNVFKVGAVVVSITGVVIIAKPDECIHFVHTILNRIHLESDEEYSLNERKYETIEALLSPTNGEPYRQLEGSLLALSSSICLAMSLIALRLCKQTPAEITILWLSIMSILTGTIALISFHEWRMPNNWLDVVYILLNGLCGTIGQWFITSALKIEQSGVISLARTFDIEVAFLYSALVLHEPIRLSSVIGSALVSCGVIAVVAAKWLGHDNDATKDSPSQAANEHQQQKEAIANNRHDPKSPPALSPAPAELNANHEPSNGALSNNKHSTHNAITTKCWPLRRKD